MSTKDISVTLGAMLNIQAMMDDVEARANRIGVLTSDLCQDARINAKTWGRWRKNISSPTFRKWNYVIGTLEKREAEHAQAVRAYESVGQNQESTINRG